MRAAILHGPGDVRIEDVARPEPDPGEVIVRIEAALTGGTISKMVRRGYHLRMGRAPLPLGHEGVGVVEAVGPGVDAFRVGERVFPSNSASCGLCPTCTRGMTAQCEDMVWMTGTYAEALRVPRRIVEANLHRVPEGLSPAAAALAENLGCVLKARDRCPARPGERAVVIGAGPLGLLWTRVLSLTQVEVTTVDLLPSRLERARALGAAEVLEGETFLEKARSCRADLVVEAIGRPETWRAAVQAAAPGGRVLLFGGPPRGTTLPLDAERFHYEELLLLSSFHHTPYHLAEALKLLAGGLLDPDLLIEERVGLDALPSLLGRPPAALPLKAAVLPA